jgi:hypothetical protein
LSTIVDDIDDCPRQETLMSNSIKRAFSRLDLRKRYGKKAGRTIKRWVQSGVLPPPDFIINNCEYWWETTIEENERGLVAGKSPAAS